MTIFHLGYLDPGTGSVVLQALVGGFLGAAYIGRKYVGRAVATIKSAFNRSGGVSQDKE